jgi:hypothetical protein
MQLVFEQLFINRQLNLDNWMGLEWLGVGRPY